MLRARAPLAFLVASSLLTLAIAGCGGGDDQYQTPKDQLYTGGKKANLPAVPKLSDMPPIKNADGYTVYGLVHQLRSRIHDKEVTAASNPPTITVVGYIVKSNLGEAPAGCVHKQGEGDKQDCNDPKICCPRNTQAPTFWIADNKGDTKGPWIKVSKWARNYAVVFDAMEEYGKLKDGEKPDKTFHDDVADQDIPFPLPVVGAKVKITGTARAGSSASDPTTYGSMESPKKIETLEPAGEKASFPQKKS